jgi:hypothetical protein
MYPVTWRSAGVTAELIAEFWTAQSVIEREPKTLVMRGEANRKNVQPVLRFCHQQGLIGRMMPLGESFADIGLGGAGGGADNFQLEMSRAWAGLAPADPPPCPVPV